MLKIMKKMINKIQIKNKNHIHRINQTNSDNFWILSFNSWFKIISDWSIIEEFSSNFKNSKTSFVANALSE